MGLYFLYFKKYWPKKKLAEVEVAEAEAETEITHRFSQMDWIFEGKMFRFTSRIGICKSYVHIHIGQGGWCNVVWGPVGLCCWISKLHLKYMVLWKYFRATRMHSSRCVLPTAVAVSGEGCLLSGVCLPKEGVCPGGCTPPPSVDRILETLPFRNYCNGW